MLGARPIRPMAHMVIYLAALFSVAAHADLRPGSDAILFSSVNENGDSVSMSDMISGKPLVLTVGSAS